MIYHFGYVLNLVCWSFMLLKDLGKLTRVRSRITVLIHISHQSYISVMSYFIFLYRFSRLWTNKSYFILYVLFFAMPLWFLNFLYCPCFYRFDKSNEQKTDVG